MVVLKITYKTHKLEKNFSDFGHMRKAYGIDTATRLAQRKAEIEAADDIDILLKASIGGCHSLNGDRLGQYSMKLNANFRLIFEVKEGVIQIAHILEVNDYHVGHH